VTITQYYDMLDQTALDIAGENERRSKYFITLWWGFDGLREGEDGDWHWVSRRKEKTPAWDTGALRAPIGYAGAQSAIIPHPAYLAQAQALLGAQNTVCLFNQQIDQGCANRLSGF